MTYQPHPMREPAAFACFALGLIAFGMAPAAPGEFLFVAACATGLFAWYGAWFVWTMHDRMNRRYNAASGEQISKEK